MKSKLFNALCCLIFLTFLAGCQSDPGGSEGGADAKAKTVKEGDVAAGGTLGMNPDYKPEAMGSKADGK